MKRNMAPLLGIAVVVAIISTGVFYGLFAGKLRSTPVATPGHPVVVAARALDRGAVLTAADLRISEVRGTLSGSFSSADQVAGATLLAEVKENEPLLAERVQSVNPKAASAVGAVPPGSRALSVRVSESDGLLAMLKPGAKVDLQAVGERGGSLELRTILQDVEVLAVNPQAQPGGGNRGSVSIMTVLVRAEDSDAVALADSGARIRLALRNPSDRQGASRRALELSSVFQSGGNRTTTVEAAADNRSVQLRVQVLRASERAARELESKLSPSAGGGEALSVARFGSPADGDALVRTLEQKREVEVIAAESLSAGMRRGAKFRVGADACQLRVQFSPEPGAGGTVNLRVRPEISFREKGGVETRVYEAELPAGSSFLVTGTLNRESLERLFPQHSWAGQRAVILVTSDAGGAPQVSALASKHRER